MGGTVFTTSDSIRELLGSLQGCADEEILLPVIDSLLQELGLSQNTNEQAYRQLVTDISAKILQANILSEDGQKQFNWLQKLATEGHDISALQALTSNIKSNSFSAPPSPPQPQATAEIAVAEETLTDSNESEEKTTEQVDKRYEEDIEKLKHDLGLFSNHVDIDSDKAISADYKQEYNGNDYNDHEIKSLKNRLQDRLESTKVQCREFESLMQLLLTDLQEVSSQSDLETTQNMLKRSIERLLTEHETISDNIVDIASELNSFENHCEQLNHELGLVKQLSMTDELTRLPNRRAFLNRLRNETGRVQRYGYPLSVALLDLDLFKEINDTYGHAVGDEVLITYTQQVLSTFRNYDLVARYGGEEFAVILPHTDIYGAERALNKVLSKTAQTKLASSHENTTIKLPSFSAGIAVYKEGESIEAVINRADKAMYSAKKLGRNRVVLETDPA